MSAPAGHRIRWYVYTGRGAERIPRSSQMRGWWPGYDVECSCGWQSRTGGGLRRYVTELAAEHKRHARRLESRQHVDGSTAIG